MLFVVELAGLKIELEAEKVEDSIREDEIPAKTKGVGNKLDNISRDGYTRVP